jgi:hypothetical protein
MREAGPKGAEEEETRVWGVWDGEREEEGLWVLPILEVLHHNGPTIHDSCSTKDARLQP